ncbi:hypothetical protein BL253_20705 [Pseudofrankia asymbiotica]|uniref:Acyl-CoA dehydrogenase n=1 Tax=Pseudofrankia asymbiotica TaxID=1834516 RepID=A0A1V2I7R6_9ACTN|nr:hypothetical protein BL253_20705 [Pseudofrankia asymbiotica]
MSVRDFVSGGSALTAEHLALRQAVRDFLADRLPTEDLVTRTESGAAFDRALWADLAGQLGAHGITVAEEHGGSGFGWVEQALVFHELGRVLYAGPYLAAVGLAIPLLAACDDQEARERWLPGLAAGELIATVALDTPMRDPLRVRREGGAARLTGRLSHVMFAAQADVLFVPVTGEDGAVSLFAVPAGAGVSARPLASLDMTREFATVDLEDAAAVPVGAPGEGDTVLDLVRDRAVLALSAEQVGGTEAVLEMAVDYAKVREQFDRPIGSFQAIKHTCSRMMLELESARALTEHAAWIADERPSMLPAAVAACGALCSEAYAQAAYDALHIHGGLGFTWEHRAHLYYRRAKSDELLFGSPGTHRARLARWICDS